MMVVQLGAQGQPDFSQPIELLMDCHRRIERFLDVLMRVTDRHVDAPLDDQGRIAMLTALDYFRHAAPRHTADEEESLFPRLRQCNDSSVVEALERVAELETDHRQAEIAHKLLDEIGRQWLRDGQVPASLYHEFRSTLEHLTAVYREHIAVEDRQVFMLAARVLDGTALAQVGDEMQKRRRDNSGRPGSQCSQRREKELGSSALIASE